MNSEEIKSLQVKVINVLTNVQTKTIGLECVKEQLTNLFGIYEESDKIEGLLADAACVKSYIATKKLSYELSQWKEDWALLDGDDIKIMLDNDDIRMNDQSNTGQE